MTINYDEDIISYHLRDIAKGTLFHYNNTIYIKISNIIMEEDITIKIPKIYIPVINLETGDMRFFHEMIKVHPTTGIMTVQRSGKT